MLSHIPPLQVTEMQLKERAGCFPLPSKGAAFNLSASIAIGAAWFSTVGLGTAKSTGAGGDSFCLLSLALKPDKIDEGNFILHTGKWREKMACSGCCREPVLARGIEI